MHRILLPWVVRSDSWQSLWSHSVHERKMITANNKPNLILYKNQLITLIQRGGEVFFVKKPDGARLIRCAK